MEAACTNMVDDGDTVLVGVNGIWGERFSDMVERQGKEVKINRKVCSYMYMHVERCF